MRVRRTAAALLVLLLLVLPGLTGCTGGADPGRDRPLAGARLEVLATWTGVEQQRFGLVLRAFAQQTGAVVRYTPARHDVARVLATRLAAGDPPDVAFVSQPGLLRDLAAAGRLVPLDTATRALVVGHVAPDLARLASYRGRLFGVWFKAADKSLLWYDEAAFERLGAVPPTDLPGLLAVARRFAAARVPAFAVAAADPWTLTDLFENLYLRQAGPERYDALAAHRLPWTDPSVAGSLRTLLALLAPDQVAGGLAGALRTRFEGAVAQLAARPAGAAMLLEGDFVAGVLTAAGGLVGTDADAVAFPAGADRAPAVVGGGDAAVLLRGSAVGAALLRYLATPGAAVPWASAGGFVSPNLDLDPATYPDALSRRVARQLLEAGGQLRFDLSDLQPAAFGGSPGTGLAAGLRDLLVRRDVAATCVRLEAQARAAFAGQP